MALDKHIEEMVEELDEKIAEIDNHKVMKAAAKLIERKNRYQAARRALLGAGNKVTGSGGNRVTQAEVVDFFKRALEPGETVRVEDIAKEMGHSSEVIRGHLNRGKGERFHKHEDNTWSLRDPKNESEDDEE